MKQKEQNALRDSFRSKTGFIIACIGSAVGMGNIWLFPYRTGGRSQGTGPLGAFSNAMKMRGLRGGKVIGIIPVIGSLGIAIGYSVVVGWFLKYLYDSLTGSLFTAEDTGAWFGSIAGNFGSVGWHLLGLAITFAVMLFGISKGIEKVNKVMMPLFFVFFIALMIRVFTLDNVTEGYEYLFVPDWQCLADVRTWVYALGQAFFSLSLAGSGTIVYGSYLKKDTDIISCARNVAFFDTCAALLAGLVIIPAVFAFGEDVASGPPLMFITLPKVFQQMPFGQLFSIVFFIAVIFAAVTSLMNLFETPIEALQTQFHLSRKAAVGIVALIAVVVGVFIENGDMVSMWMDVVSIYIIPLGAMLAAIMFFWVCPKGFAREQVQLGREKTVGRWFEPMTKYVFVGLTLAVYILGIFFGGIG